MIVLAVPVKDLSSAKQRLAAVLGAASRHALARAMLEDVLDAAERGLPGAALVVTHDAEVLELCRQRGVACLVEPDNLGHTEAVARAQEHAAMLGAEAFATIPGDVPCAGADELQALVATAAAPPAVVLVPSLSGFGTNAALLRPPSAMPLKFGEPSFDNHVVAARRRGLPVTVLRLPGLGLDIDGPEDLEELLARGPATRSARLIAALR